MKKLNKKFTVTVDYNPNNTLNISFCDENGKMLVETFKLKTALTEKTLLKMIKNVEKDLQ
jgi:hypothetical protein